MLLEPVTLELGVLLRVPVLLGVPELVSLELGVLLGVADTVAVELTLDVVVRERLAVRELVSDELKLLELDKLALGVPVSDTETLDEGVMLRVGEAVRLFVVVPLGVIELLGV